MIWKFNEINQRDLKLPQNNQLIKELEIKGISIIRTKTKFNKKKS
jgi:hypothetical protein